MSSSYSTVFHKKNSTPGVTPALSALSAAEIAVNIHDGILFTKTINDTLKIFLNKDLLPYTLNTNLSAVTPQYGQNVVTQVLSNILGGYLNEASGAGSSVINGEQNTVSGDFGIIGGGAQNKISSAGDFSGILGGHHNLINHSNCFTLGSNLTSHAVNFTYANNISAQAIFASSIEISPAGITFPDNTTQTTAFTGIPLDWMTLVRGYNTTPALLATIGTGEVYAYVYNSSPSNITYYRFISTDGSTDAFYTTWNGSVVSGLVASKTITL